MRWGPEYSSIFFIDNLGAVFFNGTPGGDGFSENVKIFDPLQILQEIFAPPPLGSEENFDPPNLVQANFGK